MLLQSYYTIRARTGPIWLIFAMTGLPGLILMYTEPDNKGGLFLFLAGSLFCLLLYIISKSMKIEIGEEGLHYQAYGRKKFMRWADMASTKMNWEIEGGHAASYNWRFLSVDNKEITIPLGYYSRHNMQLLAGYVTERAKNAVLSESVYTIANGKFPWFLF